MASTRLLAGFMGLATVTRTQLPRMDQLPQRTVAAAAAVVAAAPSPRRLAAVAKAKRRSLPTKPQLLPTKAQLHGCLTHSRRQGTGRRSQR